MLARRLLMVPPMAFAYNPQTARDNVFQQQLADVQQVKRLAMQEFNAMQQRLQQAGIEVLLLNTPEHAHCPDAVFPNNWLMTQAGGTVSYFPMATANRQAEVTPEAVCRLFTDAGLEITRQQDVRVQANGRVLEGTGAMVLDHQHKRIFAALAQRCERSLLVEFADQLGWQWVAFDTEDEQGQAIYHTNVMLSIGQRQVVVCSQAIVATQRQQVLAALGRNHEVIEINLEQMQQHFCANILQVQNQQGLTFWVMSESAYQGFTAEQRQQLQQSGELLITPIPTIEAVGGGSCRCMLAEVFLPDA